MKFFTLFLLIGCALSSEIVKDVGDSNYWDEIIDQAIDAAKSDIIVNNFERIQVPNVDKEFYFYVLNIIPSYVAVSLHGAELGDITSISRRGHVTVLQDDVSGNITVATSLGLDKLYLNSSNLYFRAIGINSNGSLIATCGSNELEAIKPGDREREKKIEV
uniref:Uncharacterized protein n=1 Tax=Rhodnius prolixus TaxID=13249 RepID=T1HXF4_RHOPR